MTEQRTRAPELPADLEWFNTERPIRLDQQRGRVVLLDFWTYSCINCMHVVPDLRYLEDKYMDGLTVIGIHSPKFPNERIGANVQKAINRYHIRHPVANDPAMQVWKRYGIRAWPSIIFIDTEGYVLGVLRGEGRRRQLDMLIAEHLEKLERAGSVNTVPPPVRLKPEAFSTAAFPGKVLAGDNRIYVSDTGHNRVIEAAMDGRVTRVFGSTGPGLLDGYQDEAAFRRPQGMVRVGDYLFVADSGNHAIRRIDLHHGDVYTVAGTGAQRRDPGKHYDDPLQAALNSPWDLAHHNGHLYIAMAGSHQIWHMDLTSNTIGPFAGSGREGIVDGEAGEAQFAQPSGLSMGEFGLYVADAETSALRFVRLPDGQVHTLAGKGLFEFGDADGPAAEARLQHPMAVVHDRAHGCLWIADSYNHKIKKMDIKSNVISTVRECPSLAEPAGLGLHGNRLWIANTNAHEIRYLDLGTGACHAVDLHEM